ncbi:hypothetical protein ZWY2020_037847 [Hordeum vulgare]|nr:hypothetical protein ZWY2020_037847 [Hordeum vulgare]
MKLIEDPANGSPSVDAVLQRYHHQDGGHDGDDEDAAAALAIVHGDDDDAGALAALRRELDDTKARVGGEEAHEGRGGEGGRAMAAGSTALWWQADVQALGAAELPEFETALRRLRDTLLRRVDALQLPIAAAPPAYMDM